MKDNLTLTLNFDQPTREDAAIAVNLVEVIETTRQVVSLTNCDWVQFVEDNGRVPNINDERKPWTYKGWLMYYRLLCEDHPAVLPRWDYWARTMLAGKLLDEPIPQIEFTSGYDRSDGYKMIDKCVNIVEHNGFGGWGSVSPLLEWLLFGFGLSDELPKFTDKLHEELYRTFSLEPFLLKPSDYFGAWISEQKGNGRNPTGFYPTPQEVVKMMCKMTFEDGQDHRAKKVCDPALGTGRFLLEASNYSFRLYGNDIDRIVLMACKINGALYAPWMVRPFPEEFFNGNC